MVFLRVQSQDLAQSRTYTSGIPKDTMSPGLASFERSSPKKGLVHIFWMDLLTPSSANPTLSQPGSGGGWPGVLNPALSNWEVLRG